MIVKNAPNYAGFTPNNSFRINKQSALSQSAHFHSSTTSFPHLCFISFPQARWPRSIPEGSTPTVYRPRSTVHDPRSTIHDPRPTAFRSPRLFGYIWHAVFCASIPFRTQRELNPGPAPGAAFRIIEEPCETYRSCCRNHHGYGSGHSGYCKGRNEDGGFWHHAGRNHRPDLHADQWAD